MCGIFGYVGNKEINLEEATNIIHHRGPDANGFLQYHPSDNNISRESSNIAKTNENRVLFGFRRLAIIDLNERSNQPYSDSSQKYHIIFNGEIYNYKEIRKELEDDGVVFRTASDTEVFLKSYIKWGVNCFKKFNGMWASSILDIPQNKLICTRDRFGIKPFFYSVSKNKDGFYFGSEIKQLFKAGLTKEINENVIRDFLDNSIVDHSRETFFKNVFNLRPGSYIEIPIKEISKYEIKNYWTLEENKDYQNLNYSDAKEHFRDLFTDSVKLRFRSDVPVGSCLSGGLDSSSIVSIAAKVFDFPIHTFTSQFDLKKYDETEYVKLVAEQYKNVNTHFCQLSEDLFTAEIDKVMFHQDEPFPTMSMLAQWEVMKLAKQSGVTVLLDGQGGDESLAGYRKFYAFYLKELLKEKKIIPFSKEFFYLVKNKEFNFFDLKGFKRYLNIKDSKFDFYSSQGNALKTQANFGFNAASSLRERSKLDIEKFSFPPLLRYEDRNSMAFSIETRIPFMDFRLVEFLYSLPSNYKIRNGFTKAILRDSLENIIPTAIQKRISKLGFETPQDVWMAGKLNSYFVKYFETMDNPYLNGNLISQSFKNSNGKNSNLFFRIFCFDKWFQTHFG